MIVTATEFKSNLGKYLEMAASQDIFITENGKKYYTGGAAVQDVSVFTKAQDTAYDFRRKPY